MLRYNDLLFSRDMLTATRDDGSEIILTRQERALLLRFVENPGALLTRQQLLQGLGDAGGALDERAVDYLINRLRKRLGDRPRKPRFIATQYGEGYYWIPEPEHVEPLSAFLLIGPVFGLQDNAESVTGFLDRLRDAISGATGSARKVLLRPDWRPDPQSDDSFSYTLDVSAHVDDTGMHLALVLRHGGSRQPISDFRRTFTRGQTAVGAQELARSLLDALWQHEAFLKGKTIEPSERPPHLRMHDAALMLTADTISWRENAARLLEAQTGEHFTDYLYKISARQFHKPIHRRNVMSGLVAHLMRHHGEEVVSPEARARLPDLMP